MTDVEPISDECLDNLRDGYSAMREERATFPRRLVGGIIARIDKAEHELVCTRLAARWRLEDLQERVSHLRNALTAIRAMTVCISHRPHIRLRRIAEYVDNTLAPNPKAKRPREAGSD